MATYVKIASVTVGAGGVASTTFSSIPSTYTDLVIKASIRHSGGDTSPIVTFNSSVGSSRFLYGTGSAAASAADSSNMYIVSGVVPSTYTANTFSNGELYIPNYAGSNYKSSSTDATTENNATGSYQSINANLWSNTSPITSITLAPSTGTWVQYSTFTLYGIKNS